MSVDVELDLGGRGIPHAYGPRPPIPVKIVQLGLPDPALSPHPVRDLELVGVPGGAPLHEPAETVGFVVATQLDQCSGGETRIADPRVSVVPVGVAAHDFGEGSG